MSTPRRVTAIAIAFLFLAVSGPQRLLAQDGVKPPTPPETPSQPPATPPPSGTEQFGQEVTLTAKTMVLLKASGKWDSAFDSIVDAFKTVYGFLDKQGIKPAGPPMVIYTDTDDAGFEFQAGVPIAEAPKNPPQGDLTVGESPTGRAVKFVHHGSYDSMDTTYEAITNFLDEKNLDAKDLFIEQYLTDPLKTPEDKLVIEIYVPLK